MSLRLEVKQSQMPVPVVEGSDQVSAASVSPEIRGAAFYCSVTEVHLTAFLSADYTHDVGLSLPISIHQSGTAKP
ncbi:hypothetical protein INR49_030483 [Caranx melampygus]|nr:hypothetical protein INR49_030483 [Caranx melampygus]